MSAWMHINPALLGEEVLRKAAFVFAQAEGPAAAAASGSGGGGSSSGAGGSSAIVQIGMFVVMFVVFYFLVMRPQSKRAKEHTSFLTNLKPNDRVVLRSGIFGKLVSIDGDAAKVEIADRVVIRVFKSQIAGAESQAAEVVDSAQK
jgi:preprotein translocase subunit YajC